MPKQFAAGHESAVSSSANRSIHIVAGRPLLQQETEATYANTFL